MNIKKNLLSNTDSIAIDLYDSNYINNKGAKLYRPESYAESVEYYRLAATMGNVQSISNLGYCYLYGRGIEADLSLAVAYFKFDIKIESEDKVYELFTFLNPKNCSIPSLAMEYVKSDIFSSFDQYIQGSLTALSMYKDWLIKGGYIIWKKKNMKTLLLK